MAGNPGLVCLPPLHRQGSVSYTHLWPVIAGGQAQRVVDAIPQEQLDALPLGRLDFIGMNIYNSVMVRALSLIHIRCV